jgi:chromosomal replication initiation ATPase DnaA
MAAAVACEIYGIDGIDLVSRRRHRHLIAARALAIWAMRQEPAHSYPAIGRTLGDRHHTSIMNLHRKAERLRQCDPAFRLHCARVLGRYLELKE